MSIWTDIAHVVLDVLRGVRTEQKVRADARAEADDARDAAALKLWMKKRRRGMIVPPESKP